MIPPQDISNADSRIRIFALPRAAFPPRISVSKLEIRNRVRNPQFTPPDQLIAWFAVEGVKVFVLRKSTLHVRRSPAARRPVILDVRPVWRGSCSASIRAKSLGVATRQTFTPRLLPHLHFRRFLSTNQVPVRWPNRRQSRNTSTPTSASSPARARYCFFSSSASAGCIRGLRICGVVHASDTASANAFVPTFSDPPSLYSRRVKPSSAFGAGIVPVRDFVSPTLPSIITRPSTTDCGPDSVRRAAEQTRIAPTSYVFHHFAEPECPEPAIGSDVRGVA